MREDHGRQRVVKRVFHCSDGRVAEVDHHSEPIQFSENQLRTQNDNDKTGLMRAKRWQVIYVYFKNILNISFDILYFAVSLNDIFYVCPCTQGYSKRSYIFFWFLEQLFIRHYPWSANVVAETTTNAAWYYAFYSHTSCSMFKISVVFLFSSGKTFESFGTRAERFVAETGCPDISYYPS